MKKNTSPPDRKELPDEVLIERYVEKVQTLSEIAADLGASLSTLSTRLRELGVELRTPAQTKLMRKFRRDELHQLYIVERWSTLRIAAHLDTTDESVARALRIYGIPVRSHVEAAKCRHLAEEVRLAKGDRIIQSWTDERRQQQAERARRSWHPSKGIQITDEDRERRRQHILALNRDPEMRQRLSETRKQQWADPDSVYNGESYWASYRDGIARKPNKLEFAVLACASGIIPGLKYVGDFSMMVGRKNPDFWVEGTDICLDVFGNYWHEGQDPQDRIDYFSEHGYTLIVIWENTWRQDLVDSVLPYIASTAKGTGTQLDAVKQVALVTSVSDVSEPAEEEPAIV